MEENILKTKILLLLYDIVKARRVKIDELLEKYLDNPTFKYVETISDSKDTLEMLKYIDEEITLFKAKYAGYEKLKENQGYQEEIKYLRNPLDIIYVAKLYLRGVIEAGNVIIGKSIRAKEADILITLDEIEEIINTNKSNWEAHKTKFAGNPIEKRKNSNLEKYKRVAQYITVFDIYLPFIIGAQRKACEIVGVSEGSFSSWKNKKDNFSKFLEWKKIENIDEKTINEIKKVIKKKLGLKI